MRRRPDLPALYDRGIAGCRRRDAGIVVAVLLELIGRLNFEYEEAARDLSRLYVDAIERSRRGRFRRTLRLFETLRGAASQRSEGGA